MNKRYYMSGLRPKIRQVHDDYEEYFAFQWETGEFKQDMTHLNEIYFDPSGDIEELTKKEFDIYVDKLKKDKGLE